MIRLHVELNSIIMNNFIISILFVCINFNIFASKTTAEKKEFKPTDYKERHVYYMYTHAKKIAKQYCVPVALIISHAIAEQGWKKMEGHRYFNILAYNRPGVWVPDDGKWVKYRTYTTIENAFIDYCELITKDTRYEGLCDKPTLRWKFYVLKRGGYATAKNYVNYCCSVSRSVIPIISKIEEWEKSHQT